jgi:hypothetical protein
VNDVVNGLNGRELAGGHFGRLIDQEEITESLIISGDSDSAGRADQQENSGDSIEGSQPKTFHFKSSDVLEKQSANIRAA